MSIKVSDLTDVEVKEGGGGNFLPVGRHVCRIVDAEESESSNRNPQIIVTLQAVEGEHVNKTIRDWWTFTDKTVPMIKRRLIAVQYEIPEGDFDLKCADLLGRPVEITVTPEIYDGQTRNKVKYYDRASIAFEGPAVPVSSAEQKIIDNVPFRAVFEGWGRESNYNPFA